jgi:hypothetical protein
MNKKLKLLAVLVISLLVVQPAFAKKHKHAHVQGVVVTSVDAIEKKIVLTIKSSGQSLSYQCPLGSTITINEETASLAQIHAGMQVISYTEGDEHLLTQLDVESKTGK